MCVCVCVNVYMCVCMYVLSDIFNKSLFPDILKITEIIPIYKEGNTESVEKYTPIKNN